MIERTLSFTKLGPIGDVRALAVVVLLYAFTACSSQPVEDIDTEAEAPARTDWNIASQNHRCERNVREKLLELGIDPDSVKGISIHRREVRRRINNRVRRQHMGYTAWVRPHDERGNLVMDLFLNCRVQRYYTRGGFTFSEADGDDQ